jgi:hypothetical protein
VGELGMSSSKELRILLLSCNARSASWNSLQRVKQKFWAAVQFVFLVLQPLYEPAQLLLTLCQVDSVPLSPSSFNFFQTQHALELPPPSNPFGNQE